MTPAPEPTVTTDEVRRFYVSGKSEEMYCASYLDQYEPEFDRWLLAHDAQVAEKARMAAFDELTIAYRRGDKNYWDLSPNVTGWIDHCRRDMEAPRA